MLTGQIMPQRELVRWFDCLLSVLSFEAMENHSESKGRKKLCRSPRSKPGTPLARICVCKRSMECIG